jgi:outer membrane protein TolC
MRRLLPLLLPLLAHAADHPDLPPEAAVARALAGHPAVMAAQAGLAVEAANRERLVAGPHEFTLRLEGARRREVPQGMSYTEQAVGLERTLRLPGKGSLDAELGDAALEEARHALGEARHETARQLLAAWFDWQRELAAAAEWQTQVELMQRQQEVAGKRVAAGDAARLELLQAEAQRVQAEAQWRQAESRAALAAEDFTLRFPGMPLSTPRIPVAPQALEGAAGQWLEWLRDHNHELLRATAASQRQRLLARRSDADRLPDPTLGLRAARERDGQERLLGLQLSLPIGGGARAAASRAALAEADAAAAREAQVRLKADADSRRALAQAAASLENWQRLAAVAARLEESAVLLDKAWRLGEGQFGELQAARRQAAEARLATAQARLDARERYYRVLLDAHRLWDFDGAGQVP